MNAVRNYMGQTLTDEEMRDIPYPLLELGGHITAKTWEVGAILGTAIGGIRAIAKSETRNIVGIQNSIARSGRTGLLLGLVLGPVVTMAAVKGKNLNHDDLYDRCYRLRYNKGQVRVDRFSDVGLALGVGSCLLAKQSIWLGAAVGVSCGCLTAAVFNAKGVDK